MGRRRNRKRERRWDQQSSDTRQRDEPKVFFAPVSYEDNRSLLLGMSQLDPVSTAPAQTCGSCREFVEDQEAGRGTCLHPGSGILSPWTDTPACPLHDRARSTSRRE